MLLLAFLAYYDLIHVATHGYARYRLPVLPVLFVLAGWTWAQRRERLKVAVPAWRRALVAGAALALAASLAPSVRTMLRPGALVLEEARHAPGAGFDAETPPGDEVRDR